VAAALDLSSLKLDGTSDEQLKAIEARIRQAEGERQVLAQKLARAEETHKEEIKKLTAVSACPARRRPCLASGPCSGLLQPG
jgi:hypothetical protein